MAALQDLDEAITLAGRGRKFSEIESMLYSFFHFHDEKQRVIAGRKPKQILQWDKANMKLLKLQSKESKKFEIKFLELFRAGVLERVTKLFQDALNRRDSKTIMEIAYAIEFLRKFEPKGDRYREAILINKRFLDKTGDKWSISKIAKEIKWPQSNSADGLSQLRRMCRQLNFPLAPSRQTRRA